MHPGSEIYVKRSRHHRLDPVHHTVNCDKLGLCQVRGARGLRQNHTVSGKHRVSVLSSVGRMIRRMSHKYDEQLFTCNKNNIMGLSKYCSCSEMFLVNGLLSFGEMLRKQIFAFRKRCITECTCNSLLLISAVYPNNRIHFQHRKSMVAQYFICMIKHIPPYFFSLLFLSFCTSWVTFLYLYFLPMDRESEINNQQQNNMEFLYSVFPD